ncbi:hypothetical protein P43SY_000329 [Pythium insidiosum]|uniref:Protein kinase domain-containing protein n=1 Tax=Pythium insidiosum TaxID=114742 RepID=A0AAD5Q3P6_PYTIN|nr:hypothetical protein P43SY_000329 [Pythium insidiosum]KAJ0397410.1 hypothetical protein ATCC90586_002758 [Pythium insidiosum]
MKSFSEEWNLCGKYDPSRRVNVVGDLKLQRKRLPHLMVEKCVRQRAVDSLKHLRNELEILLFLVRFAQLNVGYMHPNVIQLRGYYMFLNKIHVFIEFCELGSLKQAYIDDPTPLLRIQTLPIESELRDAIRQICAGVAYLHSNGVAHCDLALENIYATQDNVLKIADFDYAVFVGAENQHKRPLADEPCRRVYGAPETYVRPGEERQIDLQKADMWAVGVIVVMLFTKKPPFDSAAPGDKGLQLYERVGLRPYLRALYLEQSAVCKLTDEMISLAEGLLQINPLKRLTAAQALETPWLSQQDDLAEGESAS